MASFTLHGLIMNSDAHALCSVLASISVIICFNSSVLYETLVYKVLYFDAKTCAMLFLSV